MSDDGRGLGDAGEGAGVRGMRERAVLVGARLLWEEQPVGGTELTLELPLDREAMWTR